LSRCSRLSRYFELIACIRVSAKLNKYGVLTLFEYVVSALLARRCNRVCVLYRVRKAYSHHTGSSSFGTSCMPFGREKLVFKLPVGSKDPLSPHTAATRFRFQYLPSPSIFAIRPNGTQLYEGLNVYCLWESNQTAAK
jgi:hypothetical protein